MAKVTDIKEATARVEAALYSAGRPLSEDDLLRASGTESRAKTQGIIQNIIKKTKAAYHAIEIAVLPDGTYVFQLKPEYSSTVRKYASKPILSNAALKTLSYVALYQPVSSKQLVSVRGTGAYAHIKELRQLDYIRYESVGRTRIYNTTEKFQKYFGIKGSADDLKARLFSKVRVPEDAARLLPP